MHHIITVYNDIFDHMDGVMQALSKNKTQWKEDYIFTMKLARQKLSNCYPEETPMTGILLTSAHIIDRFQQL